MGNTFSMQNAFKVFTEVCTEVEGRGVDEMKNVISNKLKWFIVRSEVGIL